MAELRQLEFRTKSQVVFDSLKQRIIAGALKPGSRLLLKPIAEEFGCSEIPVREAFRSLEAADLVELVPHGGARVSQLRLEELVELTEIRAMLEPEATCQAAPHVDQAALRQLHGILDKMERLVKAGHADEYGRLNRNFHGRIIDFCPNRKLVGLINDLWDRAERGRIVYRARPDHMPHSLSQHRAFVRFIEAGDIAGLRSLAVEHSRFGLESIAQLAEVQARAAEGGRR